MKSMGFYLLTLALLAFLGACGKNNESGKSYMSPYCQPGMNCNAVAPIQTNIQAAYQAQLENPCFGQMYQPTYPNTGYPGYPNTGYPQTNMSYQRIPVTRDIQLPGIVNINDIFLGVTTYGDVAVLQGTGTGMARMTAYLCPRSAYSSQGILGISSIAVSALSSCSVRSITAMNITLNDGVARFRDPSFGIIDPYSMRQLGKFSFCR